MSGSGKTRRPRPCARSARSRSGPYGRSSGRLVGAQVPHADATAQAALVDQFESLHTTWRKLEAVDHIWAVSDLHVEHESNFQFISSLHGFEKDALIVAGDVCSSLKLLRRTLQTLVRIFRHVFYCVGNHELWLGAEDASRDSFAKLVACYTVASEVGAHTAPVLLDNPAGLEIAILPLQSWYHCNFLKGGPAIDMPREHELFMMDSACAWPSAIARSSTSAELAAFFARLNTNAIANARTAKLGNAPVSEDEESYVEAQRVVISFSHFLPRPELHRTHPSKLGNRLGDVEGSLFLGDQVSQLAPDAHIFGHSHFNIDMTLDHIRFLQHPLGNPKERADSEGVGEFPLCNQTSKECPLALVWSRFAGVAKGESDPSELSGWLAKLGAQWQARNSCTGRLRSTRSIDTTESERIRQASGTR